MGWPSKCPRAHAVRVAPGDKRPRYRRLTPQSYVDLPLHTEFDRTARPRLPIISAKAAIAVGRDLLGSTDMPTTVTDGKFERLLVHEIPRLRRYARALTRDREWADDLVQDCLCRALAKAHLWKQDTNIRAWLLTMLHNQHCSDIRRSIRRDTKALSAVLTEMPTQGDNLAARLQLRDFERALGRLPETQRQVVLLIGLEGMRYDEVAVITGVPIGTVRSRIARARETLRMLLGSTEAAAVPPIAGSLSALARGADLPHRAAFSCRNGAGTAPI
jgi:RNA polymerase sigma-70 factor, ECF subfamily